ncbi:DeoR/GlpR family DNA-binding transcription regulator [bacterium]|nr:DeoR/GlpR family DNA-binding transcription regulator [bacterium]
MNSSVTDVSTRQIEIINKLQDCGSVSVKDLARDFAVSEMTIRRDLARLQNRGLLQRTHGGGAPAGKLKFLQNALLHYTASVTKSAIGELAASLVSPGETIMVDSGSTTLEVARHLPKSLGLTIATTSLCVAQELYGSPIQVMVLGGILRSDFPGLIGPITDSILSNLHVNTLFIGCDGADSQNGFYMSDLNASGQERAMIRVADRVILVTESTKFKRCTFARFAAPYEIDTIITDPGISQTDKANLEEAGVKVLIANTTQS